MAWFDCNAHTYYSMQFYDIGKITFMHILVFYSQKCRTFSLSHILCFGWIFHGSLSRGVGNRIPTRSKKKSVRERWICFFRGGMQHRPRRVPFRRSSLARCHCFPCFMWIFGRQRKADSAATGMHPDHRIGRFLPDKGCVTTPKHLWLWERTK